MYERFTERAQKSLQLSTQEAERLGDEAIGTEHLLLGLSKENSGVAAAALRNLGVDLNDLRTEVERLRGEGPRA